MNSYVTLGVVLENADAPGIVTEYPRLLALESTDCNSEVS